MVDIIDADHYRRRAKDERRKADVLQEPAAAEAHRRLAELYDEKALQLLGVIETD
jgi:hypothetical protein